MRLTKFSKTVLADFASVRFFCGAKRQSRVMISTEECSCEAWGFESSVQKPVHFSHLGCVSGSGVVSLVIDLAVLEAFRG